MGGVAMAPGYGVLDRLQQALAGERQAQSVPGTKHVPYWQQKGQEGVTKSLPHFIWATQPLPSAPTQPVCTGGKHLTLWMWLKLSHSWAASTQHNVLETNVLAWPVPTWGGLPLGSNPQSHCPLYLSCQCRGRQGTQFWLHFRAGLVFYWGVSPPAPPNLISAPLSIPAGHLLLQKIPGN